LSGSLKDQLKAWKGESPEDLEEGSAGDAPRASSAATTSAARRERAEPEPEPERAPTDEEPSDEELFLKAVAGVDDKSAAILAKYDSRDDPEALKRVHREQQSGQTQEESERALFLEAIGQVDGAAVARTKAEPEGGATKAARRFARRVARGDIEPGNVLDLHGDDRLRALERLKRFLDAEAAARTEVVLVVHGKGQGILASEVAAALDEHGQVLEHVEAPAQQGGAGARVVRLRDAKKR
jgi:DNA-nicking Smr family endonuclease